MGRCRRVAGYRRNSCFDHSERITSTIGLLGGRCGLLEQDLPQEYEIAGTSYRWTEDVLRDVARTSNEASFAKPEAKEKLRGDLNARPFE